MSAAALMRQANLPLAGRSMELREFERAMSSSADAPAPLALFLANHAWRHNPYQSIIHLIDIELARQQSDPAEVRALARRWGIERVWDHLCAMIDWFIYQEGAAPGVLHRWWSRHLPDTREKTVLEIYSGSWGRGLAAPTRAEQIETIAHDVRFSFTAHSWQNRRQKLGRIALGMRSLSRPASEHLKG